MFLMEGRGVYKVHAENLCHILQEVGSQSVIYCTRSCRYYSEHCQHQGYSLAGITLHFPEYKYLSVYLDSEIIYLPITTR